MLRNYFTDIEQEYLEHNIHRSLNVPAHRDTDKSLHWHPHSSCSSRISSLRLSLESRPWRWVLTVIITFFCFIFVGEHAIGLSTSPHTPVIKVSLYSFNSKFNSSLSKAFTILLTKEILKLHLYISREESSLVLCSPEGWQRPRPWARGRISWLWFGSDYMDGPSLEVSLFPPWSCRFLPAAASYHPSCPLPSEPWLLFYWCCVACNKID